MTQQTTVRLTTAQALVRYLSVQYSVADGVRRRLVPAALGIFGHGNVAGLGQALDRYADDLPFIQGRNEQALVHLASGFAKASLRRSALAVTASIGPGALNMVTGAGLATVNRLPVLLLPGDSYATRRQGPVLQMSTMGREFGNEFRYRDAPLELPAGQPARLTGGYLRLDLVQVAAGLGAHAVRATTAAEVRRALEKTRGELRPVVIVVPVIPHADLPPAGCWWDVAPAEVSESDTVQQARAGYEAGLRTQRWFG